MNLKRKLAVLVLVGVIPLSLVGCMKKDTKTTEVNPPSTETIVATQTIGLEDGTYSVEFKSDSKMFRVSDAYEGKAVLTVKDGKATAHLVVTSTNIQKLFLGTAEDAQKDGAQVIEAVEESVTYSDGSTDKTNAFDVPVAKCDEEFDLALLGKKGKWYDHKVSFCNPQAVQETVKTDCKMYADGDYTVELTLEGGSGKASITSPAALKIVDGKMTLTVEWSSKNYDYMIVDGTKYLPVNTEGNSKFEIPVTSVDGSLKVIADTVAMSKAHEVEYVITFGTVTAQ